MGPGSPHSWVSALLWASRNSGSRHMQTPGIALWSLVDAGNKPNPDPAPGALPEQLFRGGRQEK